MNLTISSLAKRILQVLGLILSSDEKYKKEWSYASWIKLTLFSDSFSSLSPLLLGGLEAKTNAYVLIAARQ